MDAASRMSHTFTNSTWVAVTESEELRFRFDHDRGYGTRQYQIPLSAVAGRDKQWAPFSASQLLPGLSDLMTNSS